MKKLFEIQGFVNKQCVYNYETLSPTLAGGMAESFVAGSDEFHKRTALVKSYNLSGMYKVYVNGKIANEYDELEAAKETARIYSEISDKLDVKIEQTKEFIKETHHGI